MSLPRPVKAVVFDMDGLIVDTETAARDFFFAVAAGLGHDFPVHVYAQMIGAPSPHGRNALQAHVGPRVDLDPLWQGWNAQFEVMVQAGVALKAGVVDLLDHLDAAGLPRAIATSSPRRDVEGHLAHHGLRPRFHALIARGDYAQGKPHPDPFLKAAEALGVAPELCLALEDSHNGVRAAHGAGMMTVMVPDLLDPTEEMRGLCVRIADSLHEVRDLLAEPGDGVMSRLHDVHHPHPIQGAST